MRRITLILNGLLIVLITLTATITVLFSGDPDTGESITIIGGAEGPTEILVEDAPLYLKLLPYAVLAAVLLMNTMVIKKSAQ